MNYQRRKNVFSRVGRLQPGRSVFNLSYEKKFTCDMGQLIPVMCDEVVPGDYWKIGNQAVIRFQPLVAPVLHEINIYAHYFFVPYRILDENWEEFITGGSDGDSSQVLPTWEPTTYDTGSLWDFLGFPVDVDCDGAYPIDYPRRAYNLVYNEFYRDENLITEVALTNEDILPRCWEKDYFTSSLPWQQKGTAPSLPIAGTTSAVWDDANIIESIPPGGATGGNFNDTTQLNNMYVNDPVGVLSARGFMNNNTVDLSTATTFDIADLRIAFQIQKFMERNARAGNRYTEFLRAHFGVSPRDDRLDRPEYIGGSKCPAIMSEVLQTSSTDATTPQGNLAGHGIGVSSAYCGKYKAQEFGLIIGIMSVMPRTNYQQGINRQWLRETRYDFYFPEFANLSEQAVINAEICCKDGDSSHNQTIFGYQGRYDEMRIKPNLVCSEMRDTFDYWHLGRKFAPGSEPTLNDDFVECIPDKRIYAVETDPGLIVSFGNIIKAFRPMPIQSEPGLVDHN